jgi:hypothetical protein
MIIALIAAFCFPLDATGIEGKAGEVINTVDELKALRDKDLICEGFFRDFGELIENGHPLEIVATTDRTKWHSNTFLEMTEQNKGKAKIGPGGELLNYEGGRPFPGLMPDDPQAAVKAAWNFNYRYTGDAWVNSWEYYLTDAKGNVKKLWGYGSVLLFNLRTDTAPKPQLDPKETEVRRKDVVRFDGPFESKGLAQLVYKYIDGNRDNDTWVYVPGLRRANRQGAGAGCDALGGFVSVVDDDWGFAGNVSDYTFELVRTVEMLVPAPADPGTVVIPEGLHSPVVKLEKRKLWNIVATPKDPNYCYSKREWFLDPENYFIINSQNYSQDGELWKNYWLCYGALKNKQAIGGITAVLSGGGCTDYKIWEGGPLINPTIDMNIDIPAQNFTLDYLRRTGR